ncbi:MAG TPA: VOC family protein [Thermoanaerobaculia bacterium]|nr:VOC family protein [Thermoanaerobaculia bacterium]
MERVTGLGVVFFKAKDSGALTEWYRTHLGLPVVATAKSPSWCEEAEPQRPARTVWSAFPRDTRYFEPSGAPFMINYRVRDLDALLAALRRVGIEVDPNVEEGEYGRFAWIMDPEGNRVELWEPPE